MLGVCQMLDVSEAHPFEACVEFVLKFRRHLAAGNMVAAEALVDVNATGVPFSETFLAPLPGSGGFSYAHPARTSSGSFHVHAWSHDQMMLNFDVPFEEAEYEGRALQARFELRRIGDKFEVTLTGAVPN